MIRYFKKSFVRYLAYGLAIALLSFLFGLFKVNALEIEQKIGGSNINGNSYFSVTTNGLTKNMNISYYYDLSNDIDYDYAVKYDLISAPTGSGSNAYKKSYYFIMSYCSNVGASVTAIYNSNYNFIDANYNTGTDCSANGYSGSLYNAYIRMAPTSVNIGTNSPLQIIYFNNVLQLQSRFTYNGYVGIIALNLVTADEYEKNLQNKNMVDQQKILIQNIVNQTTAIVGAVGGLASNITNVQSSVDNVKSSVDSVNSSINNDNVSEAESKATDFFNNFSTNTHGLTGIITAPLTAISSITSSTCTPLVLPLPFVDEDLTLPCMRPIYEEFFGDFMTLYDIIVLGIVSYWIVVRIFSLVKDFKNPEHDEVEVMEL